MKSKYTFKMKMVWRQFSLLTRKNFILLYRNKVWTSFEILMPIFISTPLFCLISMSSLNINNMDNPAMNFTPTVVTGTHLDIYEDFSSIQKQWCSRPSVVMAYGSLSPDVDKFVKKLKERYKSDSFQIIFEKFNTIESLKSALRADLSTDPMNETTHLCPYEKFFGGIWFEELDYVSNVLSYSILMPSELFGVKQKWEFDDDWSGMYGPVPDDLSLPDFPPYWNLGVITLQMAIDSEFIEKTSNTSQSHHQFQVLRIPEQKFFLNSMGAILPMIPVLWGVVALFPVLQAAKDVSYDKTIMKDFLSVMGLSTPIFYLSHVLWTWLKINLIFLGGSLIIALNLENINVLILPVIIALYGLGTVMFGVTVASMFRNSGNAVKMTILAWLLSVLIANIPSFIPETRTMCFIYSLNVNGAFNLLIKTISDFQNSQEEIAWSNLFYQGGLQFSIGEIMVLMIVSIISMFILTLQLDLALRDPERTFLVSKLFVKPIEKQYKQCDTKKHHSSSSATKPLLKIDHLRKTYSATLEKVVDDLNMDVHAGEVTVLLGQNGAGKSTTFGMICGLVKPTGGNIYICDKHVKFHDNRSNLGYCPQTNPLYEKLTVMEHLKLVHGFKGAKSDFEEEANNLLKHVDLIDKKDVWACQLSGGMKRKLCVCMAVIGESKVILLDEPTAGIDPKARKDVQNLLQKIKKERAILLSTHYMDEAEVLGDKVAILVSGQLECEGTTDELKKMYGVGYVLTVVCSAMERRRYTTETIIMCGKHFGVDGIREYKTNGLSVQFILPRDKQDFFPLLLQEMESLQLELGISSFGIDLTTLEQVFLKIGENDEKEKNQKNDIYQNLIDAKKDSRYRGLDLQWSQVKAIFKKRWLYTSRNWWQLTIQFLTPLTVLCLLGYASVQPLNVQNMEQYRNMQFSSNKAANVLIHKDGDNYIHDKYGKVVNSSKHCQLIEAPSAFSLLTFLEALPKLYPPPSMGAMFSHNSTKILFTNRAYHSLPISLNLMNNARLQQATNDMSSSINMNLMTYSADRNQQSFDRNALVHQILGILLVISLALLTSTVIMFLVEERVTSFRHQQSLTGVSPVIFWGASFLYDFLLYLLACAIFTVVFLVFGWMRNFMTQVFIIWILYFWACMPFIYGISFLFNSPAKANIILLFWQIIAVLIALVIITVFRLNINTWSSQQLVDFVQIVLTLCFPSYALADGLTMLGAMAIFHWEITQPDWERLYFIHKSLTAFGALSFTVFLTFQCSWMRLHFIKCWQWKDQREERKFKKRNASFDHFEKVSLLEKSAELDDEYQTTALQTEKLAKYYGKLRALDHVSLEVKDGECFGLLGVNGSGKTTAFSILTGQTIPTAGSAKINNKDTSKHLSLGYCPQANALMIDLTGRETLLIISGLFGYKDPEKISNLMLQTVGLVEQADKLVSYYSGGQRRKLCVGLALLATSRIVILDECTAGIDAKARKDIWNVLKAIQNEKNSAILFTSHSMEECEALCNRVGILDKGELKTVNTCQQLKSLYGKSYTLTIIVSSIEQKTEIHSRVMKDFKATLKYGLQNESLTMIWEIEKGSMDTLGSLFRRSDKIAKELNAKDFSFTHSSLENALLNMLDAIDENTSRRMIPDTLRNMEKDDREFFEHIRNVKAEVEKLMRRNQDEEKYVRNKLMNNVADYWKEKSFQERLDLIQGKQPVNDREILTTEKKNKTDSVSASNEYVKSNTL